MTLVCRIFSWMLSWMLSWIRLASNGPLMANRRPINWAASGGSGRIRTDGITAAHVAVGLLIADVRGPSPVAHHPAPQPLGL